MINRQILRLGTRLQSAAPCRNATVVKRVYPPKRLPGNPTQAEINKTVFTDDFVHFRYHVEEETDAEPADIKVLLLKTSEG